jgi:hypothetical protein
MHVKYIIFNIQKIIIKKIEYKNNDRKLYLLKKKVKKLFNLKKKYTINIILIFIIKFYVDEIVNELKIIEWFLAILTDVIIIK